MVREYSIMPSCRGVFSKNPANCQVSCSTTRHNSHASPLVNSNHRRPCAARFTQNFEEIETPLIHGAQQLPCFAHCHLAKLCRALRSRIAHISGKLRFSLPPLGIITYSALNPRLAPGRFDLCRHLFGGARRAVALVRVGFGLRAGGAGGLGDAGNEALGQLDRAFHGAAGRPPGSGKSEVRRSKPEVEGKGRRDWNKSKEPRSKLRGIDSMIS